MMIVLIIIFLALLGLCSWALIFFFLKQKSPKCSYDTVKMITTATLLMIQIPADAFLTFLSIDGFSIENFDLAQLVAVIGYFSTGQLVNTVILFNFYAFICEYREPKIDPKLPSWLIWILGTLIPFSLSLATNAVDKMVDFSFGRGFVTYLTGVESEER